jgi:hypothetical protein
LPIISKILHAIVSIPGLTLLPVNEKCTIPDSNCGKLTYIYISCTKRGLMVIWPLKKKYGHINQAQYSPGSHKWDWDDNKRETWKIDCKYISLLLLLLTVAGLPGCWIECQVPNTLPPPHTHIHIHST